MRSNRAELALLRGKSTPEALAQWTDSFAGGSTETAQRYAAVLARFTGKQGKSGEYEAYVGVYSPATRVAYTLALTEFFEWIATKHGHVVAPPDVTRKDAEDYVQWLTARPYSLEGEKLRDGDQQERLAIYELVKKLGSTDILSIATGLPAWLIGAHPSRSDKRAIDQAWLNHELGRMVLHDLLVRTPTMKELRREDPRIGVSVFTVAVPEGTQVHMVPLPEIFFYSVPKPRSVSRATVCVRLAALTAFWDALTAGENAAGKGSLLQYNVFRDLADRARKGLSADTRAAADRKGRLSPQLVERLLHAADGPTLVEKRDAALLWLLVLTGARLTEITRLRREPPPAHEDTQRWPGWFDGRANPPIIELVRKGGFRQRLPYPPYALKALLGFQAFLAQHAPLQGTQSTDPAGLHYLSPTAPGWRYKLLTDEPDAPLLPPLSFWGANSSRNYQEFKPNTSVRPEYRKPITRNGVDVALKRIARKAGFTEEEVALVHGHAFRHFAATAMSRQGKPVREIQHMLGHSSIVTTERYIERESEGQVLSGQNEILDFLAGAAHEPPAPAEPAAARQPPVRAPRPVVETYGVPAPSERPERAERAERPPRAPAATRPKARRPARPATELQLLERSDLPAQSPRVGPDAVVPTGRGLVAIVDDGPPVPPGSEVRGGISPPSPVHAYAGLKPAPPGVLAGDRLSEQEPIEFSRVNRRSGRSGERKLKNLAAAGDKRDLVQQNPFLRENYDPWPINYGIGESSLLPWFARGSASANGEVTVEVRDKSGAKKLVVVPPLPVLARKQMDPSLAPLHAKKLWETVEHMRMRFLRTSPTKAFGLDRWWGAFLKMLEGLERGTQGKFRWVPFEASATLGKDIRAHDEEYLITWLELNAERYTTTIRAFEGIERVRGKSEMDDAEWEAFRATWQDASLVGVSPAEELPDWFIADDPVRDIYDKSRDEWEWFSKWIGAITGQKLTKVRQETLSNEVAFAETERLARIEQARELLKAYYETVELLRTSGGEAEERESERKTLQFLTAQLADYGVPDPKEMLKAGELKKRQKREASIEQLLSKAFPDVGVDAVDPNVLRSQMFDKDALRIDHVKKTISHTDEFRAVFAERHDGRDSECVMRRAARGMWEHVKRHGIPVERGAKRSSEYSLLYSVMLSYMAWIFPAPKEIEARMAEEHRTGKEARLTWLRGVRQTSTGFLRIQKDMDEQALLLLASDNGLDRKSAGEVLEASLVADSLRAEVALPSPEIADALAKSVVKSGQVVVSHGGAVVRRRAGAPQIRKREAEAEREEVDDETEPTAWEQLLTVGGPEGEDLIPNAPPPRYMTLGAFAAAVDYIANAERALPSAIRMMAAMTLPF